MPPEFEISKKIFEALMLQRRAEQELQALRGRDLFFNRSSLASQANNLIDVRDASQRVVESNLGDLSPEIRKTVVETFLEKFPGDSYATNIRKMIREIDGI